MSEYLDLEEPIVPLVNDVNYFNLLTGKIVVGTSNNSGKRSGTKVGNYSYYDQIHNIGTNAGETKKLTNGKRSGTRVGNYSYYDQIHKGE